MSKVKSTRSTQHKTNEEINQKETKVSALRKVFYISEQLLKVGTNALRLERFYHPGKGRKVLFVTCNEEEIMEVLEFAEPRRSWLINSNICSNGRIYMTTPFDVTFLALHHIRKHCTQKALALDSIRDEQDRSTMRIFKKFVQPEQLRCVADVKTAGADMIFYKYNADKAIAWLAIKTRQVAAMLRLASVHCGHSALSQNYARSEIATEELVQDIDYLRMACDYIGGYIDLDLQDELLQYLEIPTEMKAKAEEQKPIIKKRRSVQTLDSSDNKKFKLEDEGSSTTKLKSSNLLDESLNISIEVKSNEEDKPTPLKERTLTAKEKSLAKGAKGTKSIASFFKK